MPLETSYIDGTISSLQLGPGWSGCTWRLRTGPALHWCSLSPTTGPAGGLFDWIRWGRATRVSRCYSHCGECTRPLHWSRHAAGPSAVPTAGSSTVSRKVTSMRWCLLKSRDISIMLYCFSLFLYALFSKRAGIAQSV
jgi:hypothetical protein